MYKLTISAGQKTDTITINANRLLIDVLRENGIYVNSPCAGRGVCGKCLVYHQEANAMIKACEHVITHDLTVRIEQTKVTAKTPVHTTLIKFQQRKGLGLAVDLGTTTIALYFVDLMQGKIIDTASCLNRQAAFGADVISRISAAINGKLLELQRMVVDDINAAIAAFLSPRRQTTIDEILVVGNPTMLHILNMTSPEPLGFAPFQTVFLEQIQTTGAVLGLNAAKVTLMPSAAAFIGADVLAGALASGLLDHRYSLLIDLGTNGELLLKKDNEYLAAATATGPAFEGATIEMGMGGVAGAINHIDWQGGQISLTSIGDSEPQGISGSGLVDAIAGLLRQGIIDETGALTISFEGKSEARYYLTDRVYLSQADIRQFQLAKSAIRTGIEILLAKAGLKPADLERVYVAGGFGFHLELDNAYLTGLLPQTFAGKVASVGNAAGSGAVLALADPDILALAIALAPAITCINLAEAAEFTDSFIANIVFSE